MTYKKQVISFVVFLLLFVLLNFVIWKRCTELLLTDKYAGGDLARMAYFMGAKHFRTTSIDLPKRHLEINKYQNQQIDVLTIGDSFSIGGGGGRNPFYQDYIASINNCTVMNVIPYPNNDSVACFSPISTLQVLYTSGYLDIIKPRVVLIESVERYCIDRFAKPFDLGKPESLDKIRQFYRETPDFTFKLPPQKFINEGNVKFVFYNLLYISSLNSSKSKVTMAVLDRPFFSVRDKNRLLFLSEDIKYIKKSNASSIKLLNENLNSMARLLKRKGIRLFFMPIVDKYNLYSKYIVNNPYPQSNFFELLRPLPKEYEFIDTKAILIDELTKGEKDIYYADDTHWSWKSIKAVFEKVKFIDCRKWNKR